MRGPVNIGEFFTPCSELMFVLYMPIRLAGQGDITMPKSLKGYEGLVEMALRYEGSAADGKYIYLTVKRLWVSSGCIGNREGWHVDGFGTNDINYLWVDNNPTDFCIQNFNLSDDHIYSMRQMEEQARAENIVKYPALDVIRVDASHVHRCPEIVAPCYRTFARVSISDDKYDLIGNAHNHDLEYRWVMNPRGIARNDTSSRKLAGL